MKRLRLAFVPFLLAALSLGAFAQQAPGSDKGVSAKSVQRLNRAPVNKNVLQVQLPKPTEFKLKNGLTVVVLEQHKLPQVLFNMWIKGGALHDPKNLPGVADFTADMMREGTTRRTSAQLAAESDQIGASLGTSASYGSAISTVSIGGLVENTDKMLDIMSDVLMNPAFPQAELDKLKQRTLPELEEQRSDPGFLADEKFNQVLYRDFPAAIVSATPESVKAITVADLKKFHETWFAPNNAILGITGDITVAQAKVLAEKYFGAWKEHPVPPVELPAIPAPQAKKAYLIDRPGSVQTNLVAGDFSLKRTDPDFIPLTVMNRILGSGASSRLFLELREEKGYTYGSYSFFTAMSYPGSFQATSEQRNNVTEGAMSSLLDELKKIREVPVPNEELDESKRSIVATFALSLERPSNLLDRWLTVKYYGLPLDYWDTYPANVAKVDPATIERVGKKYIDLDHLQIVVVGDAGQPGTEDKEKPKTIKEVVSGFAPTEVFDAEGKPMTGGAAKPQK
jgi:predicted Zn-dependent peptidase